MSPDMWPWTWYLRGARFPAPDYWLGKLEPYSAMLCRGSRGIQNERYLWSLLFKRGPGLHLHYVHAQVQPWQHDIELAKKFVEETDPEVILARCKDLFGTSK